MKLKLHNSFSFSTIKKSKDFLTTLVVLLFILIGGQLSAQTISVTGVATTPVCAGSTVTVTFTATNGNGSIRHFINTTVFTAYLSAVGGSTPYSSIGTFTVPSLPASGVNGTVNSAAKSVTYLAPFP